MRNRGRHVARPLPRRFTGWAIPISLAMVLVMGSVAFADNVVNNVTVGGNDTFVAGGSTTISFRIVATSGDGQTGCNASDGSAAMVTINTPPGVTASPNPLTFSVCSTFVPTTFSSNTPGNYPITVSVSDPGPGTYNTTPANFTLKVLAPPDSTPPVITSNITGTLGLDGWYTSDVALSWTVSDPESTVTSQTGCGPQSVTSDTTGLSFTCSATSAGGTASKTETIKRDATMPDVYDDGPTFGPDGANGWYVNPVDNKFSASDATSGLADMSRASFNVSTGSSEGSTVTVASGPVADVAGNSNPGIPSASFMVDLSDPVLACAAVMAPKFLLNQSGAMVSATVSDGISGPDDATVSGTADTSSVGSHSMSLTGYDNAGRSATIDCPYKVIYDFNGFFRPVDNLPVFNKVKAGSAVPVKFSLAGDQGLLIFAAGHPGSAVTSCTNGTYDPIEETVTAGSSSLSYDPTTGQYNYVWKTDKAWAGTCRMLKVRLVDGETYTASFQFTK